MAKTKLRWEFPPQQEMHTIEVHGIYNRGLNSNFTYLRPCLYAISEQDKVVKILYCTSDGRFFRRKGEGWSELKPYISYNQLSGKRASGWSGSWHPCMTHFGNKHCHLLVAHAWIGPRPKGMQCDHLNGDLLNWSADNLQYVTPQENMRRSKLLKRMRKIGLDPKWLYHTILRGIYTITHEQAELIIDRFRFEAGTRDDALTTASINGTFAYLLDELKSQQL